ncbi:MAG: hypothetical protein K0Q95_3344 [Bacteroidota bacterium]|nr:hypothetical protein [Bacteroidota bacterium]
MKTVIIGFALLSVLFVSSCAPEKKKDENAPQISTDVINVPATASDVVAPAGSAPVMTFSEEKHDFGKITQGEKVTYSFVFKNNGGSDLVISSAQGSCGCTVPSYPQTPIKPGESGKVDVMFNSEGKAGLTQKTVTLVTNCNPSTKMIAISATVIVPEEE